MMFGPQVWHWIKTMASPRVASGGARESEPTALPRPILVDGFARIVRAGRQVPAIHPKQRRDRPAIEGDGTEEWRFRRAMHQAHLYGSPFLCMKTKRPPSSP
jgi:hypothetical protein